MASTPSERLAITSIPMTPGSRVLRTPLSDETIWKRLREAGFDEESIKRRDKAALIAYIAKLEAEIYDHQHHMGLLILEKKEWGSKYEQIKALAESAELMHKRDQAAHASALAEAKKREENLKKAVGVEKECIASIEKALHEMRAECAETKVAAETRLAEARSIMEDAQKKFAQAETKLHTAQSLEAEASRSHRGAERKLHEVEAREDDLRRSIISFKSDCDAKEKDILLERQSLYERQKTLQQSQERLLDAQALLNQREDYIFSRSEELNQREKALEASKANIDEELTVLIEEKSTLELNAASLKAREKDVVRKECELNKREEDLLILQQKLESKEYDELQQAMANHEASFRARKAEFEAELEVKRKCVEEELEAKRRAWELREVDFRQREDLILEKEHDLDVQSRALADKEKDLTERINMLEEKEKNVIVAEGAVDLNNSLLQKEKEELNKLKLSLQNSMDLLEEKKKEVAETEEKMETMRRETNELMILEMRLKEEIDTIRTHKQELEAQSDELKAEKVKFEAEWELIDEKREELQKEAERTAEERTAIFKFLKDERDSLKVEKDAMRDRYKCDLESLSHDRENTMREIEHERSKWFGKIQEERADFLQDIEIQRREHENSVNKRREEIESYLREREKVFEEEKKKELQYISSLREMASKEMEQVNLEMNKLVAERLEINLDREKREKEWAELSNSIEELNVQRQKLENQRELLHTDREQILAQIEQMKILEDLKAVPDRISVPRIQHLMSNGNNASAKRVLKRQTAVSDARLDRNDKMNDDKGIDHSSRKVSDVASPVSTPLSWLKRCADTLLDRTQSNKKRKQLKDVIVIPSEDTARTSVMSINASEDKHVGMSTNQIPGSTEETTVYIDKIIRIQEVTSVEVCDSQFQEKIIAEKREAKLSDPENALEKAKHKQAVEEVTTSQ